MQVHAARSTFRQGSETRRREQQLHPRNGRFLRQWAMFEKRAGDLEVGGWVGSVGVYLQPTPPAVCLRASATPHPCQPSALPATVLPPHHTVPQRSAELYRLAAKADPRDERTWLQWGLLERRRQRPEAALHAFAQGAKAAPHNPYIWQARPAPLRCA